MGFNNLEILLGNDVSICQGLDEVDVKVKQLSIDYIASNQKKFDKYMTLFTMNLESIVNLLKMDKENTDKIFKMAEDEYFNFLLYGKEVEDNILKHIFIIEEDETMFKVIVDACDFFLTNIDVDRIEILPTMKKIFINYSEKDKTDKFALDAKLFNKIKKAIIYVYNKKEVEIEKEKVFKDSRKQQMYEKFAEGRAKRELKERIEIEDMVNIIQYGGNSYISTDEIKKFTLFQLKVAFESIWKRSNYNDSLFYVSSYHYKVEKAIPHWNNDLKIRNIIS